MAGMQGQNPLALEVLGELKWETFEADLKALAQRITLDDGARQTWLRDCRTVSEQLRGKDKRKNKPWKHASELSIPLTKKLLRRWIPAMYNLFAYADPVSYFEANDLAPSQKVQACEEFFTWLVKRFMDKTGAEVRYLLHDIGTKGMGYLGVSWDYHKEQESRVVNVPAIFPQGVPQDERAIIEQLVSTYEIQQMQHKDLVRGLQQAARLILQGAQYVKISFERVVRNKPKVTRHDPFNVIVPTDSAAAEDADYVALIHEVTPSQLRMMARNGVLNKDAVEALIARLGEGAKESDSTPKGYPHEARQADINKREEQQDAGVTPQVDSDKIRIYQVYCMMDKNGDGISERVVLWYYPGEERTVLAVHDFPFSFRYWPLFRFDYEDVDRRPYMARGIGQLLKDIQHQFNKQYRARSDAIDIQLSPVYQRRMTTKTMMRSLEFGPGRVWDVAQIGDIAPVEKNPFNLHEYLQAEGELKGFAEEMVGTVDAALQATGRNLERRTAYEVQQVAGQIEAIQSMDAAIFQDQMGKVFQCVWELWLDLGPSEVFFQVTGEEEPRTFRKAEYNYRFQLTPAGTPGNTNRRAEVQMLMTLAESGMQVVPDMLNRGFVYQEIARRLDRRIAKQVLLPEAVARQQQIVAQFAQKLTQGELPPAIQAAMANVNSGGGAGGGPA